MDTILLTPAALVDILSQVEELKDFDIGVTETDADIQLHIGDSTYSLDTAKAHDIEVEEEVVEEVEDVNDETYEELGDEVNLESVESGVLKELVKTLMVGGLIRLSSKLLK